MNLKIFSFTTLLFFALVTSAGFAEADGLKDKLDNFSISGFVDTSWSGSNLNTPKTAGFGLDQVELDIEYDEGNVGLRFDLNGFPSAGGNVSQDGLFEQGYITYTVPSIGKDGLKFTFGKFNAPIGWELLDAPDMYQFSHALVFNYGVPTNLTGAMLTAAYGIVDATVYFTDGLDQNATQVSGAKTFGGRLGLTPIEGVNVGLSYIQDKNTNIVGSRALKVLDIDATVELVDHLLLGAEYNETRSMQAIGVKTRAFMLVGHYDLSDMFGATIRYDYFNFDRASGGRSYAYTGALTAALGGGLGALFEVRSDRNSAIAADPNGTPGNTSITSYALEMTYGF